MAEERVVLFTSNPYIFHQDQNLDSLREQYVHSILGQVDSMYMEFFEFVSCDSEIMPFNLQGFSTIRFKIELKLRPKRIEQVAKDLQVQN